jgi:catechol 2,3-dioxygenase-like lactoylglutathione lyase family enzyme
MLANAKLIAFGATANPAKALAFYTEVLGLTLRSEDDFAISLDSEGVELRLQKVDRFVPHPFTSLGWQVGGIADVVDRLTRRGVTLERYPWLEQDVRGIWLAPSGARVAWFKDPDGNLLSIAQYPVA